MPEGLFSWELLATLAGASTVTYLIVAYTKALVDRFWKVGTDLYAVLIGAIVLVTATLGTGGKITLLAVLLCLFNGFLVAATAGKMSDKAILEASKKQGTDAGM